MIYHQIEFGCKRLIGLELIKDTVNIWLSLSYFDYISPHYDLDLEDSIPFFRHDILAHGGAPQYQVWLQKIQTQKGSNERLLSTCCVFVLI